MSRAARTSLGGLVHHVLNRANGRQTIFERDRDFAAFEKILEETKERVGTRILGYCLMPNHWHLVLWPSADGGTGHLYQGRFKSFVVQTDAHYLTVCRYVERNALRANLVQRAEDWRWGSLWRRQCGTPVQRSLLSKGPLSLPRDWVRRVNEPETPGELEAIQNCVVRGAPYGSASWIKKTAKRFGLESTLRPRGRPPGPTKKRERPQ